MSDGNTYVSKGLVILKMLFPGAVTRWVMAIMLAVFLIALTLTELLKLDLIGIVAGIAGIHLMLMVIAAMPSQMVAFASSRTGSFLSGPRESLLISYWLFSVLLSLAICWLWDLTQLNQYSPLMFLAVWLTTSLMFQTSVYLSTRWSMAHYFIYSLYLMLGDILSWLDTYNPFYIAFCVLVSWVLFARWWLTWKPAKYKPNWLFVGMNAQHKLRWAQHRNSWFCAGPAKTWLGSRLVGIPDGWVACSKRFLPRLIMVPLGFIPGYFFMGDEWLKAMGVFFLLVGGGILAQGVLLSYGLNLRRIWLYSPGARNELFALLQKRFWLDVLLPTLLLILSAISMCVLWEAWKSLEAWFYFLLSLFLMQLLAFHLYWWMYQRAYASLAWPNLVCVALLLWWFSMSLATGFLVKWPATWPVISPLWIVVPELLLLALLYKPARLGFAKVNFARAG